MPDKTIKDIIKTHADSLMAIPGVVGIAEGRHEGTPCILIFVVDKNPELLKRLPMNLEGYFVITEESGEFRAL